MPDLPRLSTLDGIDVLPPGSWAGLRRAYGFALASEMVRQEVRVTGDRLALDPLLPPRSRARLLALLAQSADDAAALAIRLKRLREHPVRAFELRLSVDGVQRSTATLTVHLVEQSAKRRGLPVGDLYWTPRVWEDLPALVHQLSHYLQLGDPSPLGFFLAAPDEALKTNGVRKDDIKEAAELLRRRRGASDKRPFFEVSTPSAEPEAEPEPATAPDLGQQPHGRPSYSSSSVLRRPIRSPSPAAGSKRSEDAVAPVLAPPPESLGFGEPTPLAPGSASPPGTASTRTGLTPSAANMPSASGEREDRTGGDPLSDQITEQSAVDYVCAYASAELGVTDIRDVQSENKGWDLEFVFADRTEQMVEVKGSRGSSAFVITRNELRQAKIHRNYALYFVFELGSERPRMIRIEDPGGKILDDHLTAYQWTVPGWRQLEPFEIPLLTRLGA